MPSMLVIDDDSDIRDSLCAFFSAIGWEVASSTNGQEALVTMSAGPFDAMVLDLDMPVLDGLSTLRAIRAKPEWDNVCIVILTGKGGVESAVTALRQGAYQYLQKPFAYESLRQILISGIVLQKAQALQGELLSGLNIEALLERICAILMTVMQPESLSVLFVNPDGTVRLAKHGNADGSTATLDVTAAHRERPFVDSVIRFGIPVLEDRDAGQLGSFLPNARSLAAAPIPAHNGAIAGIIDIESTLGNAFDRNWLDALRFYGNLIGISLSINESAKAKAQAEVWHRLPIAARELGHIIRTPLHIIGFQLHALRTKDLCARELELLSPALAASIRERAEIMTEKTSELTSACALLNDITQDFPFHPRRADLAAIVQSCVTDFRSSIEDNGIFLTHVIEVEQMAPLLADPGLVRYAIQCLLSNAREAVLERFRLYRTGEWVLDAESWTPSVRVLLAVDAAADQAVVTVIDTGVGITPDNRSRLFQPLFTTKRRAGLGLNTNSGIGLFTVKRIVAIHGGQIEFRSDWGEGTEFKLRFPLIAAKQSEEEP